MSERVEGWTAIPNWIARDPKISTNAKAVYMALSSRLGRDGVVIPKHATIAAEMGMSVSTVRRALHDLRELGVLSWRPQYRPDGSQSSNVYAILAHPFSPPPQPEGQSSVNRGEGVFTGDQGGCSRVNDQEGDSLEEHSSVGGDVGTTTHQGEAATAPPAEEAPAPSRSGWTPSPAAMKTARETVTMVDVPLHLARYRVVCHEKKRTPSSAEWLRWLIADEQRALDDARKQDASERRKRRWDAVAD